MSSPASSPERRRLLIVDDDAAFLRLAKRILGGRFEAHTCRTPEEAIDLIAHDRFDALLADLYFDQVETGMDGFSLIRAARDLSPDLPVIVLSRTQDTRDITRALECGAFHFVTKHFERDELANLIERAASAAFFQRVYEVQRTREAELAGDIIYKCDAMQKVVEEASRFAASEMPVLITGESGTGKDLLAQLIHVRSGRSGLLQSVNITALPETLFERELFGHEKGAFTDARNAGRGLLEQADGGSLFVDEIGALGRDRQAALLRVIEDGVVRRLGSEHERKVDVRFIFATNDDLVEMRRRQSFRDDLWFRISQLQIHLPPLREREQDAVHIAENILAARGKELAESARRVILDYPWPGNVRELLGILERACLFDTDEVVDAKDLMTSDFANRVAAGQGNGSVPTRDGGLVLPPVEELLPYERGKEVVIGGLKQRLVEYALAVSGGNVTRATELLGVTRQSFYSWMRDLGYEHQNGREQEAEG